MRVIRPGSRLVHEVPEMEEQEIQWPVSSLPLVRTPRYAHKQVGNANRKRIFVSLN